MRRVTPLARLCGLENEYVLRTSPARGMPHPTTRKVFRALSEVLQEHVRAARTPEVGAESWFLENGGRIYLERIVEDWGLVECATPECRGPVEAVLFQAAQELMLRDLVAPLETDLADTGPAASTSSETPRTPTATCTDRRRATTPTSRPGRGCSSSARCCCPFPRSRSCS